MVGKVYQTYEEYLENLRAYRHARRNGIVKVVTDELKRERYLAARKRAKIARKVRELEAEGFYTKSDLKAIRERQNDNCAYCKTPLSGKGYRDHIVPLTSGGSNHPENIQWLCKRCSDFKGSKPERQFLAERQ